MCQEERDGTVWRGSQAAHFACSLVGEDGSRDQLKGKVDRGKDGSGVRHSRGRSLVQRGSPQHALRRG